VRSTHSALPAGSSMMKRAARLIVFDPNAVFVAGDDLAFDREPKPGGSRANRELRKEEFVAVAAAYAVTRVGYDRLQ
jgi:hypothetical protein